MESDQAAPVIRDDVRLIGESEQLGALFEALAAAQGEFLPLGKEATAEVRNKEGKHLYNFDYCPLDAVIAATQPALTKHKIAFVQLTNGDSLFTILAHGQARIESRIGLLNWDTPQQLGAMLTYFKRYARLGMLSVFPAGEDDDGNAASGNAASGNQAAVKPRQPSPPANPKLAPVAGAVTPATRAKLISLAKEVGFQKADLEKLMSEHMCGTLDTLTEPNGARVVVELARLRAQ